MEFLNGLNHLMNALPFNLCSVALLAVVLCGHRAGAQVIVADTPTFT